MSRAGVGLGQGEGSVHLLVDACIDDRTVLLTMFGQTAIPFFGLSVGKASVSGALRPLHFFPLDRLWGI
jgi:hypothetical protein